VAASKTGNLPERNCLLRQAARLSSELQLINEPKPHLPSVAHVCRHSEDAGNPLRDDLSSVERGHRKPAAPFRSDPDSQRGKCFIGGHS
jgi:hypothetical protein